MDKVKVVICVPNLHGGGAERVALQLARGLDPQHFDARLYVHERQGTLLGMISPEMQVTFQNDKPYRRNQLPRNFLGSLDQARDADVVVGANEGRASALALVAGRLLGKPVALWLHTDWARFSQRVSWRQRLALRLYRHASAVVACSDGAARSFAGMFPQIPLRTISNGIPVAQVRRLAEEPLPPEDQALFTDPVVVTVGRLDHPKAHDLLIAAHAQLREGGHWHRLVILGEGPLRGALEDQARELGVADSVHFLGFQSNPYRYMRHATVFALSSRYEGFGLVLAEALACGLPVVSADCPSGPREVLDGGRFGMLVPPENAAELAAGIGALLADPERRKELVRISGERAQDYDISTMVDGWSRLLQVLARPPAR
ncbi:glycosyltransferase [Paracoccus sp. CPCC 101403]|uniref:Glycosyltransferase n=1 Tax=Paracoccus broussonetiae TaxID=3075834 RepID=A0ABU3EGK5_9RHOB|nr:glycosyltransferase [Paracoccus sp. CPCC 101403]MDT1063368.1 glycosyltransferase [Paracoccus sp. CPCC 101403]